MQIIDTVVAETKSHTFKAVIWGKHDGHIMDWNGCNYRYMVIRGQPRHGFAVPHGVLRWWQSLSAEQQYSEKERALDIQGTHIGPYAKYPALGKSLEYKQYDPS